MPAAQKTPLSLTLNSFSARKAEEAIWNLGKALPCSVLSVQGSIVTVKFEVVGPFTLQPVTMPVFGPEYIRYPIQVGDRGITVPTDAYLGPTSGLGAGVADVTVPQANLANLVFLPCGNANWSAVDPSAVTVYGPNGVVLRDSASTSTLVLLPSGVAVSGSNYVHVTCGACSIVMTPTEVTIRDSTNHFSPSNMASTWDGILNWLASHVHGNGNAGGNTTSPTTAPPGTNIAPEN